MSTRLQDLEDRTLRQTWQEADGTAYRRVYNVPEGTVDAAGLPVEGDAMPGESSTVLGPFIERGGISFGKQPSGAMRQVILKCRLLKARS